MATYARKPEDVLKATAGSSGDSMEQSSVPEPKRTLQECDRIMTAPGAVYEWEQKTIFGRDLRVFKNLPPSLRDFWLLASQAWADREYLVLGDERLTFKEVCAQCLPCCLYGLRDVGPDDNPSNCDLLPGLLSPLRTDAQTSRRRRGHARQRV